MGRIWISICQTQVLNTIRVGSLYYAIWGRYVCYNLYSAGVIVKKTGSAARPNSNQSPSLSNCKTRGNILPLPFLCFWYNGDNGRTCLNLSFPKQNPMGLCVCIVSWKTPPARMKSDKSVTEQYRCKLSKPFVEARAGWFIWDLGERRECLLELPIGRRGGWSLNPPAVVCLRLRVALRMLNLHFAPGSQTDLMTSYTSGEELRQKADWHSTFEVIDSARFWARTELCATETTEIRAELKDSDTGHWKRLLNYLFKSIVVGI